MAPREVNLAYVWIPEGAYPEPANSYQLISPNAARLAELPYPCETEFCRLDLTILNFFTKDLPDLTRNAEGLLDLSINTRNPRDPADKERIRNSMNFTARDGNDVPGFRFRRVFRSILFRNLVELECQLVEIDATLEDGYRKLQEVLGAVEGISVVDVALGLPCVTMASRIMGGVVEVFGQSGQRDMVWKNEMSLELRPPPGAAFLRSGIYVLYEGDSGVSVEDAQLFFRGGAVHQADGHSMPPNYLCLSVGITAAAT